jgi:N-carbamoylputrescine amidase
VGHEGDAGSGIEFWGQSFVCDPAGRIMAKGSIDQEELVIAECNLGLVDVQRTHWPFLRDRRIDAYDGLTKRLID